MESETLKEYKVENETAKQAEANLKLFEALTICIEKTNFVRTTVTISACAHEFILISDEDKLRFKIKVEDIKNASEALLKTTTDLLQSISNQKKEEK